jgi:hypothetical protein
VLKQTLFLEKHLALFRTALNCSHKTLAFKPLSNFTSEAVKKLIKGLKGNAQTLDLHCQKRLLELSEKKLRISKKMEQLEQLKDDGVLDEREYQALVTRNKPILESYELEIDDFMDSNDSIFNKGLKVIELFKKAYDYMELGDDLLAKAKMAKIVLSNPILTEGSIGFLRKSVR